MKKIPTLYVRDQVTHLVVDQRHPDCLWVGDKDVPQIATMKYDGTCVRRDDEGIWWHRREVKAGQPWPEQFELADEDAITHKTVGWVPIGPSSPIAKYWGEAITEPVSAWTAGTYELIGPKVNANPHHIDRHVLVKHGQHMIFGVPTDFGGLKAYLEYFNGEGIVWHTKDGRMAKIKRRDFGWTWGGGR